MSDAPCLSEQPPVWIGTSWKMHKTREQARAFAKVLSGAPGDPQIQRFVMPPFTAIAEVREALADTDTLVGAQNMHWADEGAWTGEVSPPMLTDYGVDLVELGHSERRAHFGETDTTVGLKVEAAVRHGLIPLICVGENDEDKRSGRACEVLREQVEKALGKLSSEQADAPMLLAYEPVWAIGENGTPATPEYADEQQASILEAAESVVGRRLPCLYGGSVNADNCAELITCQNVDGLFIGRSAWRIEGFLDILARCAAALSTPRPDGPLKPENPK